MKKILPLLAFLVFGCSDKQTLGPTETMLSLSEKPIPAGAVLFVDENDKRKGWQWYNAEGALTSTVWEITSQAEMDTATTNQAPGDTILVQTAIVKVLGLGDEQAAFHGIVLLDDYQNGQPAINLIDDGSTTDYARWIKMMNFSQDHPTVIDGFSLVTTDVTPTLNRYGMMLENVNGSGQEVVARNVWLTFTTLGDSFYFSCSGVNTLRVDGVGPTERIVVNASHLDDIDRFTLYLDDVEFVDLDSDPCNPPVTYYGEAGADDLVWEKWSEYDGDTYDITSGNKGSIANHTLVDVTGASCKASIKFQYDDGSTDNDNLRTAAKGHYGDDACDTFKNATWSASYWNYSFNTNSYADCDWHHGARITLCDGNDEVPETHVDGTCYIAQGGIEYSCGICN